MKSEEEPQSRGRIYNISNKDTTVLYKKKKRRGNYKLIRKKTF